MPLAKRGEAPVVEKPVVTAAATLSPDVTAAPKVEAAKTRAAKASKDVPLNKEDYWNRKEERDIETGKRIRRSGVWQAALGSVGLLQLNAGNTFESYLALVAKAAEEGLKFVNAD